MHCATKSLLKLWIRWVGGLSGSMSVTLALLVGSCILPAFAADDVSIVRGGRLYDDWSRELRERPPSELHPAFPIGISGVSAADTWRCKECHGWDYKGSHGIVGIRPNKGSDPAAIVSVLKNATHRYEEVLHERDLLDLATFVSHGQIDMSAAIESGHLSPGMVATYEKYFSTICASCHGFDGGKLREIAPLGDAARHHPSAVLHVIANGHPGGGMPALGALGAQFAARMLSFLQTLPSVNLSASIVHGGRLYDDWQAELGARKQSLPQPAYPKSASYANDAQLTWRCVSCHGPDYQGSTGVFANGRQATGIKGVRAMVGVSAALIESILRNSTHRFDAVLQGRDLQDLANFVSLGQVDMDSAIDRQTLRMKGDGARGSAYYRSICAGCHNVDGRRVAAAPLGRVVRTDPWGSLHTILNGHPDEKMPALRELDFQLLIDILAHIQGLPDTR